MIDNIGDFMKNINVKNKFSFVWVFCIIILLVISLCSVSISLKGTSAHFGGVTGELTAYKVTYLSNYVNMALENESYEEQKKNIYQVLDNMFDVPSGYKFIGWNTKSDGTGDGYVASDVITLKSSLELYAQWISVVYYGDVNQNGQIDKEDYVLIENHISGVNILTEQSLLNADVNIDGHVDLVDADIVKQAYLGTMGYTGYLPNNPILIYDIYEGNIDIGSNDNKNEEGNIENGNSSSNGNGSLGTGNNSSGSGNNNIVNGSNNHSNNTSNNSNLDINKDNNDQLIEHNVYKFKFMNGDLEYANTQCDILDNGTCELVLPDNNPLKNGYVFKGWSENKGCSSGSGIIAPIVVNSNNTYYACFIVNSSEEDDNNSSYVWIIVIFICIMSLRLIFNLVHKFKEKEENEDI